MNEADFTRIGLRSKPMLRWAFAPIRGGMGVCGGKGVR